MWDNLVDKPRSLYDVNFDGEVTPLDALLVINFINANGLQALAPDDPILDLDINNDGLVTPLDVLLVVNHQDVMMADDFEEPSSADGEMEDDGDDPLRAQARTRSADAARREPTDIEEPVDLEQILDEIATAVRWGA